MRATTNELTGVWPSPAHIDHGAATGWPARVRRLAGAAGIALGALLSACGGGGGDHETRQVPAITAQPADASVVEGSAARFSVTAVGASTLAYQWSSSSDGGASFAAIAGATSASYSTGATSQAQSGTRYRVVVANDVGSVTSSSVALTVTASIVAPSITVQPADVVVTAPNSASFYVTAAGTALSYAWQSSSDGTAFAAVPGAPDAPTLALGETTSSLSGSSYRVVVSNGVGTVTSVAAVLTVNATPTAPMFTTQPASQSIFAAMPVDFVIAASGLPTPTVSWTLNGAAIADGALGGPCAGATASGATTATLSLSTVPLSCSGAVIVAVASNGVAPNATSASATLTVNFVPVEPTITTQPVDTSVPAGSSATFTAAAFGVPTPRVQWQTSIDGLPFSNIVGATSGSYTTPPTVLTDNGRQFRAVFAGLASTVPSNPATLTITAPGPTLSLLAGDIGGASGSTDDTGVVARFNSPLGIAADAAGNIYVADYSNETVRKITPAGVTSTLAGTPGSRGSADGFGAAARFSGDAGTAVDGAGNVFVSDSDSHTIRKINPMGVVTTLAGTVGVTGHADGVGAAAQFNHPAGLAADAMGNVYVADQFNDTIRMITPAGVVSTIAGQPRSAGSNDGTGAMARFNQPTGIAVDGAGNLYVADFGNAIIRKIAPDGAVTTLAGSAGALGHADGSGPMASFNQPEGVAVDAAGNVFVTDTGNQTVRKVTAAGVVTTVVGVAGDARILLGNDPRLYYPISLTMLSGNRIAISTQNAIVVANLP